MHTTARPRSSGPGRSTSVADAMSAPARPLLSPRHRRYLAGIALAVLVLALCFPVTRASFIG